MKTFIALAVAAPAVLAAGQTYELTDLTPSGYLDGFFRGAGGRYAVGSGSVPIDFPGFPDARAVRAFVWDQQTGTFTDLDPLNAFSGSFANGAGGDQQVGFAFTSGDNFALLWSGKPGSVIALDTNGTISTVANDTDGINQVGAAITPTSDGNSRAFLWKGTAESGRELALPPTFQSTIAFAIDNGAIGGTGEDADFLQAAVYWANEDAAPIVIRPAGFEETRLTDVENGLAFGSGYGSRTGFQRHAFVWDPNSPASGIDLHPPVFPFTFSAIEAVGAGLQVGIVAFENENFEFIEHAAVWFGTAGSFIDLHGEVEEVLGPTFRFSQALGVDDFGILYGTAFDAAGAFRAVRWSPVTTAGCNRADLAEAFGVLDINDVLAFATAFGSGEAEGDFVDDGVLDINDILAFAATFGAGCP